HGVHHPLALDQAPVQQRKTGDAHQTDECRRDQLPRVVPWIEPTGIRNHSSRLLRAKKTKRRGRARKRGPVRSQKEVGGSLSEYCFGYVSSGLDLLPGWRGWLPDPRTVTDQVLWVIDSPKSGVGAGALGLSVGATAIEAAGPSAVPWVACWSSAGP